MVVAVRVAAAIVEEQDVRVDSTVRVLRTRPIAAAGGISIAIAATSGQE